MPFLSPCARCLRHIRARDLVCPFCFAAALVVGGCKPSGDAIATDAAPPVASASASSSAAPSSAPSLSGGINPSAAGSFGGLLSDGRGAAVYGGPTPPGPHPVMRETSVVVDGPLPREVVQRIVRQRFGYFRACYLEGLRDDAKLRGTVGVSFTVEKSGAVTAATLVPASTTLRTKGVQDCLVHAASELSFPAPESPVHVVYTLAFFPNGDE